MDTAKYPVKQLSGIHDLIFSDRYALKEPNRENISVGDKVVVLVSTDGEWEKRSVGHIVSVDHVKKRAEIQLAETEEIIEKSLDVIDKCLETSPSQMWDRMAKWLPIKTEKPEQVEKWQEEYRWLLEDWKFSPGGRINTTLGTEELFSSDESIQMTCLNCFVLAIKPDNDQYGIDSRDAIMDTSKRIVQTLSKGGGVGISVSPLRPSNAYITGVNGRSSGSVGWGAMFSYLAGQVSQSGSRRGAMMILLDCSHPDIIEFIFSKVKKTDIPNMRQKWQTKFPNANFVAHETNNANISVAISDVFMDAVKNDNEWQLVFPDYEKVGVDLYNREWDGIIDNWIRKGYPIKVYDTIKARDLWDCLMESAWQSAEPGVVFLERYNKLSNSWYHDYIICVNPCSEQGLPANGACDLGHINLAEFTIGKIGESEVLWDDLSRAIKSGVRFLDSIIDYTYFPLSEQEIQAKKERRIGLGTLGLGEMLIRCGIKYGSQKSIAFIKKLYRFIVVESYKASIDLAVEKCSYPAYEYTNFATSGFAQKVIKELPEEYLRKLRTTGIRNVTLTTQAPCGSTGSMIGTSTGIEPYYSFKYLRNSRLGSREINERIVEDFINELDDNAELDILPDYFVTALELTPREHISVQAAIQEWVCSSISKTANVPNEFTVKQTKELYELAYDLGCKGITIYRSGSRDIQVLDTVDEISPEEGQVPHDVPSYTKRPNLIYGQTEKIKMPSVGKLYITTNSTSEDGVVEVFVHAGENDTEVSALCNYIGRLISTARKYGVPLEDIVNQGDKCPAGEPFFYKGDLDTKGKLLKNIPSVISHVLRRFSESEGKITKWELITGCIDASEVEVKMLPCPACGGQLRNEEGCLNCSQCGYSKCQ